MSKYQKLSFIVRMIYFVIQFFLLFTMINRFLHVGWLFYIFLVLYCIYVIKVLCELLLKNINYQNDAVYNLMQIGLYFYITIIFVRINISNIYYNSNTEMYFVVNFLVLIFLLIIIMIYSKLELEIKKWGEDERRIRKTSKK